MSARSFDLSVSSAARPPRQVCPAIPGRRQERFVPSHTFVATKLRDHCVSGWIVWIAHLQQSCAPWRLATPLLGTDPEEWRRSQGGVRGVWGRSGGLLVALRRLLPVLGGGSQAQWYWGRVYWHCWGGTMGKGKALFFYQNMKLVCVKTNTKRKLSETEMRKTTPRFSQNFRFCPALPGFGFVRSFFARFCPVSPVFCPISPRFCLKMPVFCRFLTVLPVLFGFVRPLFAWFRASLVWNRNSDWHTKIQKGLNQHISSQIYQITQFSHIVKVFQAHKIIKSSKSSISVQCLKSFKHSNFSKFPIFS